MRDILCVAVAGLLSVEGPEAGEACAPLPGRGLRRVIAVLGRADLGSLHPVLKAGQVKEAE